MRMWCYGLSDLGWGQSAGPEYHDLKQKLEGARQAAKDAQLSYQQTLQQSNLAIQNANPVFQQQQLAYNAPTTPTLTPRTARL
ncbi:BZ3500_MvSof-1268-A1-R1_Chr5-2g08104 [Microbotryum saponariae]|uniref:BZ3500_MvSof-1268-A1-R1_Chr5-2g08104 protein n=1 Tax=Microbotryum saponariae TaxID=289078 RepID=A0A2X0M245_9BASI|nr:BZ3500_MvSof-1268-A1-R1_Chr5-2g08104 [Microbotryum saponariae]SDA05973.1 BZ3501_MvSof-1269-A2-R1_Chr5-2g07926 [Microbotryum saponariae]